MTEVERHVSAETVRNGARLLRASSQVLTGGADGLHHTHSNGDETPAPEAASETTPLTAPAPAARARLQRQESSRAMRQGLTPNQVQEQLQTEGMEMLTRNAPWIILVCILSICLFIAIMVFFVQAILGLCFHHDKECDQPLKYYLIVTVLWSQIPGQIQKAILSAEASWQVKIGVALATAIPGWAIMGWGVYMVHTAETCHKTNPGLFFPTRRYIYFQLALAAFSFAVVVFFAFSARHIMLYVSSLMEGSGCAEAVKALPKIEAGAQELIAEDGEVTGCPICMETLSKGAVRTPCEHYFHEDCLATWCKNHLTCPMCREQVGDADDTKAGEP